VRPQARFTPTGLSPTLQDRDAAPEGKILDGTPEKGGAAPVGFQEVECHFGPRHRNDKAR
jgi:hypothetical protein